MEFGEWLQQQLTERQWNAYDLVESAKARGYRLDVALIYRILNRETEGGVNTVIAIAHGLRLSRKEVFVARGWLTPDGSDGGRVSDDPDLAAFVHEASILPAHIRQPLLSAAYAMLEALRAVQPATDSDQSQNLEQDSTPWVTVEEAAAQSGYNIRTVQKLLKDQKIIGKKRGKQWFTTLEAVLQHKDTARPGRPSPSD